MVALLDGAEREHASPLEPTDDHHPAALRQRLRGVVGLVAPHDHGEERRLLLPPTRHRHPEHGPGDPGLGVADLGVVGEVAGEADARLGHCGWGSGMPSTVRPDPSTRGVVENEAPTTSAARQLGPGSAGSALDLSQVWRRCALGWPLEQRPGRVMREHHGANVGEVLPEVVVLEALASRLEDARMEALASMARTQRGPAVVPLRERAGQ
jgi:hypothetical protein